MIKFKEHDGLVFRMLDKPVPLKENDANVLVRFITHGIIGEYVMEHWLDCNQKNVPIFVKDVDSDGDVTVCIENGNEHICCPFPMFEIIGTPVAEGSAEWALWAMMEENKVINSNSTVPFTLTDDRIVRIDDSVSWDVGHWLRIFDDTTGWQIYKEPKHKTLLDNAKVGDLCKRMDGKWVQIETLCSLGGMPWICYEIGGLRYINNGEQLNTKDRNLDIIDYHPLAPEGTAEWALQMWKLGNDIRNETGVVLMADYESEEIRVKHLVDVFSSGWQIYKEPEPEPAKEPIANCDKCKHICTKSNIDYCQMYEPKPKSQYKVGDWVKYDIDSYLQVIEPSGKDRTLCRTLSGIMVYPYTSCLTKASPADVVIHIGCIKGTVRSCEHDGGCVRVISGDRVIAHIMTDVLEQPTRNLVRQLLKAQEEHND